MDLLFQRYASPFFLLDRFIQAGRFTEFIDEFIDIHNSEKEEKANWEYYLHRVFDKSYSDFLQSVRTSYNVTTAMNKSEFETTVNTSKDILSNFIPE